jgi:deazaflavin-dependent oxidoreductase (nitroreductase family)
MAGSSRKPGPPRWLVRMSAPVAMAISGHRWFPLFAILRHRGRRTGRAYSTPVAVIPTVSTDVFLIGLPWGPKTNWAGNVRAAGGAVLRWKGRDHQATEPRLITPVEAATLATPLFRPVVSRFPAAIVLQRQ